MRVLVTGGAGFVGSHVVERLVGLGCDVVVLDDLSTGNLGNLDEVVDSNVEIHVGSILDPDALEPAGAGCEAIVHLAALPSVPRSIADPTTSLEVNATGTLRVLEWARRSGGTHVIVASSSSVYGAQPELPKHERLATRPLSPYAASKSAAEQYALAWQYSYGLPTLAFRFFNVYGPRQPPGHAYAAVIPVFCSHALSGLALPLDGDGSQSRDFTYVGTLADIVARACVEGKTSVEPVNLAFGTRTTLNELIDRLAEICGRPIDVEHRPVRAGDVAHSQADCTLLESLLGDLDPVALDDGLRSTVDWMRTWLRSHPADVAGSVAAAAT